MEFYLEEFNVEDYRSKSVEEEEEHLIGEETITYEEIEDLRENEPITAEELEDLREDEVQDSGHEIVDGPEAVARMNIKKEDTPKKKTF